MTPFRDGEEPMEEAIPSSSIGHKDAMRRKYKEDTEAYLANGGKISQATTSGLGNNHLRFVIDADREENDRRNAEAEASRAKGNRRSISTKKANRELVERFN